jgi:hypothetical protein
LILIKAPGGSSAGQAYPLTADTIVLGREETCDIVIPNHAVSRRHAQISRTNGRYFIDDLKSRNHTFVNNREIGSPAELKNDDRIKICDFLFRFHDERVAPASDRPRLPPEYTTPPDAAVEDPGGLSTIEHTVAARQAAGILEVQPSEKLRALLEISTGLSKTLELDPLLNQIAETVLGMFRQADRCFIILQEEGERLIAKVVKTRRPSAGDDPRFSRTIVRRCLKSQGRT